MSNISRRLALIRDRFWLVLDGRQGSRDLEQLPHPVVDSHGIQLPPIVGPSNAKGREMPLFVADLCRHLSGRHVRSEVADVVDDDEPVSVVPVDGVLFLQKSDRPAVGGEDWERATTFVVADVYDLRPWLGELGKGLQGDVVDIYTGEVYGAACCVF